MAGRKLGRTTAHRQAMLRNMSASLFQRERIRTTLAKAKELRPFAERLVTLSKRESLHARRQVLRQIPDRQIVAKLFDTISARYAQRPGGYTRIIKLGPRRGDHAEMAIIELVEAESGSADAAEAPATKKTKSAKPAKKTTKTTKKKSPAKPATTKKKTTGKKTASKKSTTKKPASKS